MRQRSRRDLFGLLAETWALELVDSSRPVSQEELKSLLIDEKRLTEWRKLCAPEEMLLGQELAREIEWALEGLSFASHRVSSLYFGKFPNVASTVGALDSKELLNIEINYGCDKSDTERYRAALVLFAVTEFYLWMGAVWDRMGQLLNLFAFNVRNIAKSRDGWRTIFERFQDNFGGVSDLRESLDYAALVELHNDVYGRISDRRNVLAHKGSLAGRLREGAEANSDTRRLFRAFILGSDSWDMKNLIEENAKFQKSCFDASQHLFRLLGQFLRWKRNGAIWKTSTSNK